MTERSKAIAQVGISAGDQIAKMALSYEPFDAEAMASKGALSVDVPQAGIAALKERLRPLRQIEPKFNGPETRKVLEAIAVIGRRIRPEMGPASAKDWAASQISALKDQPPALLVAAADRANADPDLEHPGQAQRVILKHCSLLRERYRMARIRLERLEQAIKFPKVALPPPELPPLTQGMISEMAGTDFGKLLCGIGLRSGLLAEDENVPGGFRLLSDEEIEKKDEARDA